jgi:hypothetical protein
MTLTTRRWHRPAPSVQPQRPRRPSPPLGRWPPAPSERSSVPSSVEAQAASPRRRREARRRPSQPRTSAWMRSELSRTCGRFD